MYLGQKSPEVMLCSFLCIVSRGIWCWWLILFFTWSLMFYGKIFWDHANTILFLKLSSTSLASIDDSCLHQLLLSWMSSCDFLIPLFLFHWLVGIYWRKSFPYLLDCSFIHVSLDSWIFILFTGLLVEYYLFWYCWNFLTDESLWEKPISHLLQFYLGV